MIKKILPLCIFLAASLMGYTQEADTSASLFVRVMIIPFNPQDYLSDADQQLAEYNQLSVEQVRERFRYGLEASLNARILSDDKFDTQRFVSDDEELNEDLKQIYYGYGLKYEKPKVPVLEDDQRAKKSFGEKLAALFRDDSPSPDALDEVNLGEVYASTPEDEYLNVHLASQRMLPELAEKYDVDFFVFLNMFEVKTDYETCLDRATNNFRREFTVHFSIFDAKGRQVYGNAARLYTDSNTLDMTEIVSRYIPKLTAFIYEQIPRNPRVKYRKSKPLTADE